MNPHRRHALRMAAAAAAASVAGPSLAFGDHDDDGLRAGTVFTSTNAAGGNEVLAFGRAASGGLQLLQRVPTGGLGSGAGLGSQGAVALGGKGRFLFVVNAGDHKVSAFLVRRHALVLTSVVDAGGLGPISVAEHDGVVYVLNAQGAGNIAGFRHVRGVLKPIADAVRPLSAAGGTAPAQVGFSADGEVLVVAERATNKLTTYRVGAGGRAGAPRVNASAGVTPFGFEFDRRNVLLVSEAFGGAAGASAVSSYRFDDDAPEIPRVVSPSVATTQTAACWVAITPNGRYAYVTNTASGTVSSYRIQRRGRIELLAAVAVDTGTGSGPIDAAVSRDGDALHVLNAGTRTVASFDIDGGGALVARAAPVGTPAGSVGLAAN